ncbi:hypothetical protein DDB_G0276315 [Dictyostelium discoideum AX4]|uniref:Uncharacterized protein n=1 Tax=Dictyostelium discoideum TaxID=44689 RepID=Q551W5_DICDI|nr:hypothetical protein DDB_G0276315 [Dictyostelium discoideum AX4]EAL69304.1 hypothetical protein DDB_G0276315 [Dictyostelium discoideum AX4]|eukprot:XP_643206.1 hypothetical protein DDB_G0276315 [Dictyostelium discoideum AX4]
MVGRVMHIVCCVNKFIGYYIVPNDIQFKNRNCSSSSGGSGGGNAIQTSRFKLFIKDHDYDEDEDEDDDDDDDVMMKKMVAIKKMKIMIKYY